MKEEIFQMVRLSDNSSFKKYFDTIDINILDKTGKNLLQEAIPHDNQEIALLLIENKINVNNRDKNGQTALHYCCVYNAKLICRKILESDNVDVNIKDHYGNNPLWTAVFNANLDSYGKDYTILRLLLASGAKCDSTNNVGKTPYDIARITNNLDLIHILDEYSK